MIKLGSQEVTKVMKGTEEVSAVYRGSDEVWSPDQGGIGEWSCIHNGDGYSFAKENIPSGQDICIEFWFRPQDVSQGAYASLCGQWSGMGAWMLCYIDGGRGPVSWMWKNDSDTYGTKVSASNLDPNRWYFVVLQSRWSEQAVKIWWDGVFQRSLSINQPLGYGSATYWQNGSGIRSGARTHGHGFRMSNIARYAGSVSFTPPTAPLEADANTICLSSVGPEVIDYSASERPISVKSAIPVNETPWS